MLNSVNIIFNRQPASQRCHQHRCSHFFAKYHLLEALYFGSVPKISARLSVFWNVFIPEKGVTHCSSTVQLRSANQRKNQLTFEAFELIPISYIVQRDSFLTQLDIEMPQRNLYAASGILKYG